MSAESSLVRVIRHLNYNRKEKLLLHQYELCKGYFIPVLFLSGKKSDSFPESKLICKEERKTPDVCVKAETLQVLANNEPAEPIPKDCGKPKVDTSSDASLRPYVNPCPPYKPCEPCFQPVHPCREKPPRIPIIQDDVQEEMSMRMKKILLALSAIVGGIIIYKALTASDEPLSDSQKRPRCVLRPQYISKTPETPSQIPREAPYLIIGGGTAAFSAFRTIKSLDPTAKILVISDEPYDPYMRPPLVKDLLSNPDRNLSKELRIPTGERGKYRSIFYEPENFFTPVMEYDDSTNGGISVVKGYAVKSIDPDKKIVTIQGGPKIKYNKCLLATGSRAKNIGVFDFNTEDVTEKVTAFRSLYDYLELEDIITCGGHKIAVIGGNNVACELASSLASRGVEVLQIFKENGVLSEILPSYLSDWVTKKLENKGVKIMKNTVIEDAMISGGKLKLITKERKCILVDHSVVVSGFEPNTDIAKTSALEIDEKLGGFLVNPELQVRTDLYAAGDCASFFDPKLEKRRRLSHHDNAITTGRIAGENMVGARKTYDKEPTFWSAIMPGIEFESIGEINSQLATVGVFLDKESAKEIYAKFEKNVNKYGKRNVNKYYPNDEYSRGILFYLRNEKVIGITMWNLVGRVSVAQRVLRSNIPYESLDESAKLFSLNSP